MQLSRLALARAAITRAVASRFLHVRAFRSQFVGWRGRPVEGNVVDPDLGLMLAIGDIIGATEMAAENAATARAQMAESAKMVEEPPVPGMFIENVKLEHEGLIVPARRYVPEGLSGPSPCIVFYHGGGFALGDLDTHDRYCQTLARDVSARVIAVDYRLAPENPFPAAVDDAVAAFRAIAGKAKEFGIDPSKMAVMGDSAGGNLSAVVSLKTRNDAIKPALQVLLYPAVDGSCSMQSHRTFAEGWFLTAKSIEWFYHQYVGDDPVRRRQPDVSPLFAPDVDGAPPALIYTAAFDPLRDEGIAYAERLTKAGIPTRQYCFDTMTHGFVIMGGVCPAAREGALRIAREVARALREGLSVQSPIAA